MKQKTIAPPIVEGRSRRKSNRADGQEDRREMILNISARRFAEFGFEATTVREIATDSEILSGSIYHHFNSKDEILHEIIRSPAISMGEECSRIAQFHADPESRLVALILLSFEELFNDQDAFSILYNEREFFRRNSNFEYVTQAKSAMFYAWKKVIEEGIEAGLFRNDLDIFMSITTIIRMLNTCADWYQHAEEPATLGIAEHSRDDLVDFNLVFALRAIRSSARIDDPLPRATAEALLASERAALAE